MGYDVDPLGYRNVRCDGCGIALCLVYPDRVTETGGWKDLQPDGALLVRLDGGYGMAIDPCGDTTGADLTLLFCKSCVPKLCEQWPPFARVVMEHASSFLGHHCSKERRFVWRSMSDCCDYVCRVCGNDSEGGWFVHARAGWYDRPVAKCSNGHEGLVDYSWERPELKATPGAEVECSHARLLRLERELDGAVLRSWAREAEERAERVRACAPNVADALESLAADMRNQVPTTTGEPDAGS